MINQLSYTNLNNKFKMKMTCHNIYKVMILKEIKLMSCQDIFKKLTIQIHKINNYKNCLMQYIIL